MDMTGEERIAASREAVWAALNDVAVLKQCIPGCESLEKTSDTDMAAKVKLQVGPVRAAFTGKVKLSDHRSPERLPHLRRRPGRRCGLRQGRRGRAPRRGRSRARF